MSFWMQKEDPEYYDDEDFELEVDELSTDDLPQFIYDPYNTVNS